MTQVFGSRKRCRIAMEVGTHSPWVSRLLKSRGREAIVVNARMCSKWRDCGGTTLRKTKRQFGAETPTGTGASRSPKGSS